MADLIQVLLLEKNDIREFVETYSNRNEITLHPLGLDDFDKLLEENGCVY